MMTAAALIIAGVVTIKANASIKASVCLAEPSPLVSFLRRRWRMRDTVCLSFDFDWIPLCLGPRLAVVQIDGD